MYRLDQLHRVRAFHRRVLMFAGVALLAVVTASFRSWLLNKVGEVEEHAQAVTRADMAALTAAVRALPEELAARGR